MSGQRHPDTETLASLRAGLVGGLRGRRMASHVARCARCAATGDDLAAVSSFLASVPAPPLPESYEQRITAALAAEAAARAMTAGEHAPDRAPAGRRPAASRRRRAPALRFRPAMAFVPLVVFLLAGFGYLLSNIGGSSNSSSSSAAFSSPSASSFAAPAAGGVQAGFAVTASGTNYTQRSLGTQVRLQMSAQYSSAGRQAMASGAGGSGAPRSTSAAGSASTIPSASAVPSRNLTGCVLRVTEGVRPALVDEASYQGKPVYVIAVPARAWVVGRGCSASDTELITTVALTATP
jgi:hypothetical protein